MAVQPEERSAELVTSARIGRHPFPCPRSADASGDAADTDSVA